eukprot:CAMPEP_0173409960 /NCGR_PEP_ID=MMETSP1356-20130122/73451_1 /TAXON_ID=77927 ORGANISM="Hemiselmis virescens, Strain PCC157" /NCGR_SAMPLE_ID=MMETSP1356 /ASSEMBLY_ACC=CAM_ASM_000847 /LENGTH=110 /DNA_ID=CAMNT_0014371521 /DNA_START=100 /DNA_END=432 /DNA_ORIENTATION=-
MPAINLPPLNLEANLFYQHLRLPPAVHQCHAIACAVTLQGCNISARELRNKPQGGWHVTSEQNHSSKAKRKPVCNRHEHTTCMTLSSHKDSLRGRSSLALPKDDCLKMIH